MVSLSVHARDAGQQRLGVAEGQVLRQPSLGVTPFLLALARGGGALQVGRLSGLYVVPQVADAPRVDLRLALAVDGGRGLG